MTKLWLNILILTLANNNDNNIPDLYSALFKYVQKRCTNNSKYKIQNQNTMNYELIYICSLKYLDTKTK